MFLLKFSYVFKYYFFIFSEILRGPEMGPERGPEGGGGGGGPGGGGPGFVYTPTKYHPLVKLRSKCSFCMASRLSVITLAVYCLVNYPAKHK